VAAGDEGWKEAREGTEAYCARAFGIGQAAALRGDDSFRLLAWARANGCPWDDATRRSVTRLVLPDGISRVGRRAFVGCTGLRRVALPATLERIEYKGFANCGALAELDLAAATRLTEIGDVAFRRCALTAVRLPDSLTRLGTSAFLGCTKLISVTLPPHLAAIEGSTFDGCTALSSWPCSCACAPRCRGWMWPC
jgi:hypothetical protein